MRNTRVYTEEPEVGKRLHDLFGTTLEELVDVLKRVAAARADHTDDDPLGTPGLLSYIHGTRNVRGLYRAKGWLRYRQENVEGVKHPTGDRVIVYQNVDLAASKMHAPRAISGKGPGTDRAIDAAQGRLFSEEMEEELKRLNGVRLSSSGEGIWFLCASFSDGSVAAELSLPAPLSGNNFGDFLERIFIIRDTDWPVVSLGADIASDAVELQPMVTRK